VKIRFKNIYLIKKIKELTGFSKKSNNITLLFEKQKKLASSNQIYYPLSLNKKYLDDTLEKIISGCRKKDISAQEMLYRMFAAKMWIVCKRYAIDTEHAKDLLQEGFLRVFDKIDQFQNKGSFEGWMRRIFINMALAEYRKKRTFLTESLNDNQGRIADDTNTDDNIDERFEGLTADELLEIINTLSPQYKIVFNLYAIEGLSHKEIAKIIGVSEGTSKSNLSRAREILRKRILNLLQQKRLIESKVKTIEMPLLMKDKK
jgi:RNA polymerase sigma-70 factor (ECF subfamily)